MKNPVRSSIKTVLHSNDQSRVLSSLIADEPKYSFMIAKDWFESHASSYSTRIGKAVHSLKKLGLIHVVKMKVKQHNSPRQLNLTGYRLNTNRIAKAFCEYLTHEKNFWRREVKEFTKEDKEILVDYLRTTTCKNFFRNHVLGKKLYGTAYKLKDSVFGALNSLNLTAVFEDETGRQLRKEMDAYYKIKDTAFIGRPDDEELFKKVRGLLGRQE